MSIQLTDEQKRVKIAEACGFKWWRRRFTDRIRLMVRSNECVMRFLFIEPPKEILKEHLELVPDYLNSLDAMADARKRLTPAQRVNYSLHLANIITRDRFLATGLNLVATPFDLCDATAAQHAEAFLCTIEEQQP